MNFQSFQHPLNIAVVGSGIAGMSSAWLLSHRHKVTMYEKDDRIGGHCNTINVPDAGTTLPVDTGFIVYNEQNYPNLTALFDLLDVPTHPTDMSFSVTIDGGRFEYASTRLVGMLAQTSNIARPRYWRMINDILRFYREAPRHLFSPPKNSPSLGDFLSDGGYSDVFVRDFLLPMGAAIWSTPTSRMLDYPAVAFLRFFENHGLIGLGGRVKWRTVTGGSRQYVKKLTGRYVDNIRLNSGVRSIRRDATGVVIEDSQGRTSRFDHVVIGAHADEALQMLGDADATEQRILRSFPFQDNDAVLHTDKRLMPKRKRAWASWNYLRRSDRTEGNEVSVTYWMNRLQSFKSSRPMLVSLNPVTEPDPETVIYRTNYGHPVFDEGSYRAQRDIWEMQGRRRTWFCGSYLGYGFHEDGIQSGLAVAEALGGVKRPWRTDREADRLQLPQDWARRPVMEVAA